MIDKLFLISEINNSCKIFFFFFTFHFSLSNTNRFKFTGINFSKAINNYNDILDEINVIKWFNDFWIYAEIKFENQNSFISVSVFQGENNDNVKHQLFRAEWDDYNNEDEKHPQPHWHITSNQVIERTFEELANMQDSDDFVSLLKEEKTKIIDVNKIHFAMNGNWINNDREVHSISDEKKIVKWFQGLLAHIKIQLEYVQ